MVDPVIWEPHQLADDIERAIDVFRDERGNEPSSVYSEFFNIFVPVFQSLIDDALPRLAETGTEVDRELLARIVSDESTRWAFRYLAAPPISEDDLRTLASSRLSVSALRADPAEAERVRDVVLNVIDPYRFPWIEAGRLPTEREEEIAVIASAVLLATQRVGTRRRNDAKRQQEERAKAVLRSIGFAEVPRRTIPLLEDGPQPGEFCGESKLGSTRADVVIRLPDRRYLAIECKVSNSAVNSFKRVNHEALGKARSWSQEFGTRHVVPGAILSGVFNADNLIGAQKRGLFLFWSHRLDDLTGFIHGCS